jgi:parvulin-like peptidyl-prolyl isomerase
MKTHFKSSLWVATGVITLAVLILLDVYATRWADPVSRSLKLFFPSQIVGWHKVSVFDVEVAQRAAQKIDPSATKAEVVSQLVREEKMRTLARRFGIGLKSDDAPDELEYLKNNPDYQDVLAQYFNNNEEDFERFVAFPRAWEALLERYYNSDITLHNDQYQLAQSLLDRINQGEKFEDLAMQYSDDRVSGQLGGDMGFFKHGEILPELEDEAVIAPLGQVINKVIVSRLGYHILYPVEGSVQGGSKVWHLKQILIKTDGFEQWFIDQSKDIRVISLNN